MKTIVGIVALYFITCAIIRVMNRCSDLEKATVALYDKIEKGNSTPSNQN